LIAKQQDEMLTPEEHRELLKTAPTGDCPQRKNENRPLLTPNFWLLTPIFRLDSKHTLAVHKLFTIAQYSLS
jgi:hypothetical protein